MGQCICEILETAISLFYKTVHMVTTALNDNDFQNFRNLPENSHLLSCY